MHSFKGWDSVVREIETLLHNYQDDILDHGQRESLIAIQNRLQIGQRALLIADEVGMGKTRIAAALIYAVKKSGGRSAVILPPNVGKQWQSEIKIFDWDEETLQPLRSYESFIQGYAPEHSDRTTERTERQRKDRLSRERQLRDLPDGRWSDESTLLISHSFANMRFPRNDNGHSWRRELLPAISAFSKGANKHIRKDWGKPTLVEATHQVAREILQHSELPSIPFLRWSDVSSNEYRTKILPFIGRALGKFDLLVVDEAHKSRGHDSSLSRILGPVTWVQPDGFRLGMTATPVELDSCQWNNTLARILGQDDAVTERDCERINSELEKIKIGIDNYSKIITRLNSEPLDEPLLCEFEKSAADFKNALSPFVIRRDKRLISEEFKNTHGVDYRNIRPIRIEPTELARDDASWLRRFCAAEALSMLPQAGRYRKLARLKLDKGLSYAFDLDPAKEIDPSEHYWISKMRAEPDDVFNHPAILKAVEIIESLADRGEKTLVFASLTKPIQALNQLLDARAMLKALSKGEHWPATTVRNESMSAVVAAMGQLNWKKTSREIKAINTLLKAQYKTTQNNRSRQLNAVFKSLLTRSDGEPTVGILRHFWNRKKNRVRRNRISEVLDAMSLVCNVETALKSSDKFISGFGELLNDLKGDAESEHSGKTFNRLEKHLDNFSKRESSFSRIMTGNTTPQTRHTLQESFNRQKTWPMVLIAQSLVGREGLNLHKACRHVVLHAEWNPAVLEQQIGRVDRKGSKWETDCAEWEKDHGNRDCTDRTPPRIEIYTISVSGSYDQHQWDTVLARWQTLRSQLHGEVVVSAEKPIHDRIQKCAPKFGPPGLQR